MDSVDRELEAAISVLAGRALLERACDVLRPQRIVPVVLKGALISAMSEGSGQAPRPMLDVDVLVTAGERATAERALVAAGLEVMARTASATTLRAHDLRLDLDLHSELIEPELFRIDAARIIERSSEDHALFGFAVRVPERTDLYAHLVAHFARTRSNARDRRRLGDLAVVARVLPMAPSALAAHLVALGLGRAARYVLTLASRAGDSFAHAVLTELPHDVVGDALALAAERWLSRFSGASPFAIPALHALNRTLPGGARSLAAHALRGARSRARGVLEGATERRSS